MKNLANLARLQLSSVAFAALVGISLQACFLPGGDFDDIEITDDSCVSHCEDVNSCGELQRDCEAVCDLFEDMDCEDAVAAYDECKADSGDVCGAHPECEEEGFAAVGCMLDYCEENPGAEGCPKAMPGE